jgi:hypothetical protein
MRCVTHPTHDSIFGDTYHGVPNPNVPHLHPYPTRYHGPIYDVPQATLPYVERPYAVTPFSGCASLGEATPPLLRSVTGSTVIDAAVGAAFGYLASPRNDQRMIWTAFGAVATTMAGTLGLVGTAAAVVVVLKGNSR